MSIGHFPRRLVRIALAGLFLAVVPHSGEAVDKPPLIFAAASMTDALNLAAARFEVATGQPAPRFSFASSSTLAKQIAEGAPADLFVSANEDWMDWLAERNAIRDETRRPIATNTLVIAGPPGTPEAADARSALADGRFAIGDPAHVPAGMYGRQALDAAGLWPAVKDRAVFGENVRIALELVRRGEVGRAIVYASDLHAAPDLVAVHTFPAENHDPICYPAALTASPRDTGAADAFLDFLLSAEGQAALKEAGFGSVSGHGASGG